MALTPQHQNVFQSLLGMVDNHGARVALQHIWDTLVEVAGGIEEAAPVVAAAVEAAAPETTPVVTAVEAGINLAGKSLAELQQIIAAAQAAMQQQPAQ